MQVMLMAHLATNIKSGKMTKKKPPNCFGGF